MSKKSLRNYFSREWVAYLFIAIFFSAIAVRLFMLQVVQAAEIKIKAQGVAQSAAAPVVERGMIVDAQDNILAKSILSYDVFADPEYLRSFLNSGGNVEKLTLEDVAQKLAEFLELDEKEILEKLQMDSQWVSLAHQVSQETGDEIRAWKAEYLNSSAIGFTDTYQRLYPMERLGAGVLGFVQDSGLGAAGVEFYYDDELMGKKNLVVGAVEPVRTNGYSLKLTLDATIQHLLEQELDVIMQECNPTRAAILAMDPMTGKVLGMGSRPTFDPAEYKVTDGENFKNLTISMIYEPGSTFKIVTCAAAIEESVVYSEQLFYDPGSLEIGINTITNWDSDMQAHGHITLAKGMMVSSNVVLSQVGQLMGKALFYDYLQSFGFGFRTKVDLGGEEQGLLIDYSRIRDIELATMSFGQANLVTPIQLLTAVNAVANGGNLYQPYILDSIFTKSGEVVLKNTPAVKRQVISQTTSATVTDILVDVVEGGTGSRAKIPGIKVAGKTGTGQKIDHDKNEYSETDFVVSFVAYAPAENPKISVLVVIDTPKGVKPQGGTLAGPRVKKILEGALQYYGIPVSATTPDHLEEWTVQQDEQATAGQSEQISQSGLGEGEVRVPALKGLTVRQAGEKLAELDLLFRMEGSGLAVQQFPEAGSVVNKGDPVEVIFRQEGTEETTETSSQGKDEGHENPGPTGVD